MTEDRKIVIFCSSSYDIDPEYNKVARDFVTAACGSGFTIVSGGAIKGTMGFVSDAARDCGGKHIGIIPRFMEEYVYPDLTQTIWTDTMAERKEKMREGTCAAVALPGGIGTLDELIETLVLAKLHRYEGKVYALNHNGFYEPLKALLQHYVDTEMLAPKDRAIIEFPDTVDELVAMLCR